MFYAEFTDPLTKFYVPTANNEREGESKRE